MSTSTSGTASAESTPGGAQEGATPDTLSDDDVFHLLQTKRRRLVLHYLRTHDGPAEMRDVAEQVAAWEHDTTVEALTSKERQRVYISLYQTHLPKMDEVGVIEYNQNRGIIEPTEHVSQLYPYLDFVEGEESAGVARAIDEDDSERDRRLATYYGGATILSTGLITFSWAGLLAISGLVVAELITALFSVLTIGMSVSQG